VGSITWVSLDEWQCVHEPGEVWRHVSESTGEQIVDVVGVTDPDGALVTAVGAFVLAMLVGAVVHEYLFAGACVTATGGEEDDGAFVMAIDNDGAFVFMNKEPDGARVSDADGAVGMQHSSSVQGLPAHGAVGDHVAYHGHNENWFSNSYPPPIGPPALYTGYIVNIPSEDSHVVGLPHPPALTRTLAVAMEPAPSVT